MERALFEVFGRLAIINRRVVPVAVKYCWNRKTLNPMLLGELTAARAKSLYCGSRMSITRVYPSSADLTAPAPTARSADSERLGPFGRKRLAIMVRVIISPLRWVYANAHGLQYQQTLWILVVARFHLGGIPHEDSC